jgi:ABC-type sugar transport system substrate-binding protein
MKRIVLIVANLAAIVVAAILAASPAAGAADKVTICHFTGSAHNPFVMITISESALAKHMSHHGDRVPVDGACRSDGPLLAAPPGL